MAKFEDLNDSQQAFQLLRCLTMAMDEVSGTEDKDRLYETAVLYGKQLGIEKQHLQQLENRTVGELVYRFLLGHEK